MVKKIIYTGSILLALGGGVVGVVGFSSGSVIRAWIGLGILVSTLIANFLLVKCKSCGARPVLWLFMFWTALIEPELFFADAVCLRKCPKCGNHVF